ncbi:MAG: heavy-metal-associated domain-containing protein [Nitrospiraceae bacterium]
MPNMVCKGCAEKIRTALSSLPGVREVKSKVPQKHVYVRYEPSKVQEFRFRKVLEEAGFVAIET